MDKTELLIQESCISARSLKRFTNHPIALVTDRRDYQNDLFDHIIYIEESEIKSFESKIVGVMHSPFDRTVFLDSDTYVCASIDGLFDALDFFDIMMAQGRPNHSYTFINNYMKDFFIRYEAVIPEFNTGLFAFKKDRCQSFFLYWLKKHKELACLADMVSFRESFIDLALENMAPHIGILPQEFNLWGFNNYVVLYNPVRVLHGRVARKWNNLRFHMASFEQMQKIANKINRHSNTKRLYVHPFGVIPYSWSIPNFITKIKRIFGIKYKKKRDTLPSKC